jgi:hypothetical protein
MNCTWNGLTFWRRGASFTDVSLGSEDSKNSISPGKQGNSSSIGSFMVHINGS